jgi:pimeloyl-ACP methyl ester carboxylesterase
VRRRPVEAAVTVNDLRHHLTVWDGGGSTTVLLLHGWLDHGRTWDFFVDALPASVDWHLVAPDWRGHGRSERVGPGGYYHFADYVRDLHVLAGQVRRERLYVVAHSMGAGVAALWLGAVPDAARRLVLVEGLGPPPVDADEVPLRMARWLDETAPFDADRFEKPMADVEHAARRLLRADPRLTPERAAHLARHGTVPGPDGTVRWAYDPLHRTRSPMPMLSSVSGAFWRRLRIPMLYVGGADSPYNHPDLTARLDASPHVRRKLLPGAGHMVQHHDPVTLAAEVVAFFGEDL